MYIHNGYSWLEVSDSYLLAYMWVIKSNIDLSYTNKILKHIKRK